MNNEWEYNEALSFPTHEEVHVKCPYCRNDYRFIKPSELVSYREQYEDIKKRYAQLYHHINTLMAFCEKEYGLNPAKDSLIKELEKLRDLFNPYD